MFRPLPSVGAGIPGYTIAQEYLEVDADQSCELELDQIDRPQHYAFCLFTLSQGRNMLTATLLI